MTDEKDTVTRSRSPSYPFIPLGKAVERLDAFVSQFHKSSARVTSAASVWNYQPKSSGLLQTIAALKGYGLIDDEGSGSDRKIRVTDLGFRLLRDQRPGVRESALEEAALKPPALKAMWDAWGPAPVPDVEVISTLHIDKGYAEDAAKRLLDVFRETVRYASLGASDIFETGNGDGEEKNRGNLDTFTPPPPKFKPKLEPNMLQDVFNLPEGQLLIQRPQNLSEDSFRDLKDWLDLVIRRASRSIKPQQGSGEPSESGGTGEGDS